MKNQRFIDGYRDSTGEVRIFSVGEGSNVCFDIRKMSKISDCRIDNAVDIALLAEHDGDLKSLARSFEASSMDELVLAEQSLQSHTKAIKTAKVDFETIPLSKLVPANVIERYYNARLSMMIELYGHLATPAKLREYDDRTRQTMASVLTVESSKIHVDVEMLEKLLKSKDVVGHERGFLEHIKGVTKDGFATTKISPVGSRTKRFRVVGGLKSMSIPHGAPRKVLTSRFENGEIHVIDFNAIDYRCIIESVGSKELSDFFGSSDDFHIKTAEVLGCERKVAKDVTYVNVYGGSPESVAKKAHISPSDAVKIITKLGEFLAPVERFRKNLAAEARKAGRVVTPSGYSVPVTSDDSDGKIIGLFAQTYSSWVFERSLAYALKILEGKKTRIFLTVHDELALDVHPDELDVTVEIKKTIERKTGFKTKLKKGKSYGEATD